MIKIKNNLVFFLIVSFVIVCVFVIYNPVVFSNWLISKNSNSNVMVSDKKLKNKDEASEKVDSEEVDSEVGGIIIAGLPLDESFEEMFRGIDSNQKNIKENNNEKYDHDKDHHGDPELIAQWAEQYTDNWLDDMGYLIPPELHSYDLILLESLVSQGDSNAMIHMGERLMFNIKNDPNHPDYQKGIDYSEKSRSYFGRALLHGNKHAAAILAETYYIDKKMVEAHAWDIVAQRLGDGLSNEWFRRTRKFKSMSERQRIKSAELAAIYVANLQKKGMKFLKVNDKSDGGSPAGNGGDTYLGSRG